VERRCRGGKGGPERVTVRNPLDRDLFFCPEGILLAVKCQSVISMIGEKGKSEPRGKCGVERKIPSCVGVDQGSP